jgi:hypothetical protein
MTKIEVDLEPEELADLEEFVKHHPKEFKNASDALKQMAGLKMYRKLKQTVDPQRKKAPILACEVGIPSFYPCALNELLQKEGKTYQEFVNETITAGINIIQKALDKGKYEIRDGQVIVDDNTQEAIEWSNNNPGVMLVAEAESSKVDVKGKAM